MATLADRKGWGSVVHDASVIQNQRYWVPNANPEKNLKCEEMWTVLQILTFYTK